MVFDPTADDLAGVHRDLWEYRAIADRWSAAIAVLYVWQRALVLFFELSDFNFEHLCRQRAPFWQGLFSASGDAIVNSDLEPDHVRDPVQLLFSFLALFLAARR